MLDPSSLYSMLAKRYQRMPRVGLWCVMMLCSCLLLVSPSHATTAKLGLKTTQTEEPAEVWSDSYGRDTPRSTVEGFMSALSSEDAQLASRYLDATFLSKSKMSDADVVAQFKQALDTGGRLEPLLQLSDAKEGDVGDLLPNDQEKVGSIRIADKSVDVLLVRKIDKDGNRYWQFADETLANLPDVHTTGRTWASYFEIEQLKVVKLFDFELSKIIALAVMVLISLAVVYVLVWALFVISRWLFPRLTGRRFAINANVIMPVAIIIVAMLLSEIMLRAGVPVTIRTPVGRLKEAVAWIATTWLAFRLIDGVFRRAEANSLKRNRPEQVSILGLLRKLAKVFMLILAIIIIFGNLGFDLTTGIAALGVGGLALAFGAQKTIENLIGSVVVVADRPVHVGDYCKFGTYEGTVIDIGIRSTRIRTLNRTIVTVPNGEFSALQIENFTARDMFYFLHNLFIKRTADLVEVERMIADLQGFLASHTLTNDEWNQVWIKELRQDCYVIEMRAYIPASGAQDFYAKQTQLALAVLKFLENYQVEHALPSQTVVLDDKNRLNQPDS
ncbi:mechanosensitive ion channel family protein [Moraxella sp. FZLJ2107]|uniref:mechanosensitive ion channel family protein n=1 Tax=unclassified Moraxella TaxID=2685852 RepID=UPI0020C84C73|nr:MULTISPECIES: mechanosensitive ion channel family protein [unclassified Moraxella]UTO05729.1 mechanosensitive ion channel family protein [Moraxella sp. FZLJ2107]UTO22465.1 mechanosensitive ion channel family protein [Moraxella sp. FZLJ2109]